MQLAAPALVALPVNLSGEDALTRCEEEVVKLSLANLMTFPFIREAVDANRLELQGFRFGIRSGVLTRLDGERFVPVL
jgi:carbonic anhydrase